ncbi:heavy metal translocating P-type ATPase [Bremerella sp. JC817]|uniref:heavy metal translocating P-type ATPase n=1 Tax=Bremerella sp. JC817 TaxID=3231756 RepID=UPI0034586F8A
MTTAQIKAKSFSNQVACTHCGQPVPGHLVRKEHDEQFCCHGCETAYRIVQEDQELFDSIQQRRSENDASLFSGHDYGFLDHESFQEANCQPIADGLVRTKFLLGGVVCASCVFSIEKLPRFLPGVVSARMNLTTSTATIDWQADAIGLSEIARTLDRLGYPPHPVVEDELEALQRQESRRQLIRLAVAGACAGNTMLIAVALYFGLFTGMDSEFFHLFRWTSAGLAMVCLVWPGRVFFQGAWQAVRAGVPHMDLPVALGLAAGATMGFVNTILQRGEIYFDSLTVLVFLLLVGRYLQYVQQRRAIQQISLLRSMLPRSVTRLLQTNVDAATECVPLEAIRVGDWIHVRAGDVIPVDGIVMHGSSLIDQAILTGESNGIPATIGDRVLSGATNLASPIIVQAQSIGAETRLGQIAELVEEGVRGKAPIVQFANRIGGYFVAVVLTLAAITIVCWAPLGIEAAINHAMALLIVACPCALGLATPLTVAIAQGRAAAKGILVKSGDVFEYLARPGVIWLDKTGTLTEGRMHLIEFFGDTSIAPAVEALERQIVHPIAEALVRDLAVPADERISATSVTDVETLPGIGVQGWIDGERISVGSSQLIAEANLFIGESLQDRLAGLIEAGDTAVVIARQSEVVAVCSLGDRVRVDAKQTIASLEEQGWTVGILSGDHQQAALRIGQAIGIAPQRILGGLSPEDKLRQIQKSNPSQTVVMVGDGVNDSAALAAASVGIAVKGGAEVSLKAASVYLNRPGTLPILETITGSQKTVRAIRRSFAVSLGYNGIAVLLSMCGLINPIVAAILMPISSLSVLAISASSGAFGQRPTKEQPVELQVQQVVS